MGHIDALEQVLEWGGKAELNRRGEVGQIRKHLGGFPTYIAHIVTVCDAGWLFSHPLDSFERPS